MDHAYLDTTAHGGILFELIQTEVGFVPMRVNRLNHRISARLGI